MYKVDPTLERTAEEKADIFKSWARDDKSFFAAGACHILADLFVQLHRHEGFKMVFIEPAAGFSGSHAYATNGIWAFDYNGWTLEAELLSAIENEYRSRYEGWRYSRIVIEPACDSLDVFCKEHNHRLPWQYPELPWSRAYSYINKHSPTPPL